MNIATSRPEPIPFYGELGSTNPVFILPGALQARGTKIASDLYGSFTLGAGQFCTKPGLIFLSGGATVREFCRGTQRQSRRSAAFSLLTKGISADYDREARNRKDLKDVDVVAEGAPRSENPYSAGAALYQTDISSFHANHALSEEHFGPSTLADSLFEQATDSRSGPQSRRPSHRDHPRHRRRFARIRGADRDSREQSRTNHLQRISHGRRSVSRDGSRRALSRQHRWTHHLRRHASNLSLCAARLLSGFSRRRSSSRASGRKSAWHLADGRRRIDTEAVVMDYPCRALSRSGKRAAWDCTSTMGRELNRECRVTQEP